MAKTKIKSGRGHKVVGVFEIGRHAPKAQAGDVDAGTSKEAEGVTREWAGTLHEGLPGQEKIRWFTPWRRYGLKGYASEKKRGQETRDWLVDSASGEKFQKLDVRQQADLFHGHGDLPGRPDVEFKGQKGFPAIQAQWIHDHYPDDTKLTKLGPGDRAEVMRQAEAASTSAALESEEFRLACARRVSWLIMRHIRKTGMMKDGSKFLDYRASHEPMLTCFLSECLVVNPSSKSPQRGFTDLKEFRDRAFEPLETMRVIVERDRRGNPSYKFELRDPSRIDSREYTLDWKRVEQLAGEYLEKHKEKRTSTGPK